MIYFSSFIYWLDLFGTAVFALSGALMAGRYKLDPFGVVVLAAVTAVGGGTIRDVILDTPVFWVQSPIYLLVILATALCVIVIIRQPRLIPKRFLLVSDALGLALFAVIGAQKALLLGAPPAVAIVMGTITGVAGGMIRDVLCNVIPLILRQEIYATIAIFAGGLFVGLRSLEVSVEIATIITIVLAFSLRLWAIYRKVSLPAFDIDDQQ
ncbi:trimeric intracellular cation channel family protein [Thalassotalea agarivorans]|uniref:Uncharacterized membrane protein YeiH n=1 Tax=Thalassotalea agarivorans TaxID=349064 RepID=A0A1I0AXM3_THASX|nr:trimeric intracellular cation channel family protein [Thalassotalea agarivorans]SES98766.1 Uncharacterized membrane protein YeiH [Thalassotalea agarivorans]